MHSWAYELQALIILRLSLFILHPWSQRPFPIRSPDRDDNISIYFSTFPPITSPIFFTLVQLTGFPKRLTVVPYVS